jgi:methyl-accepting chemotaxis protein
MFKNLRLKQSILLAYSIPLLLAIIAFIVIYFCAQSTIRSNAQAQNAYQAMILANQIEAEIIGMQRTARSYLLQKNEGFIEHYGTIEKRCQALSQELLSRIDKTEQVEQLQEILGLINQDTKEHRAWFALVDGGKGDEALSRFISHSFAGNNYSQKISDLIDKYQVAMQKDNRDAESAASLLNTSIFAGIFFAVTLSLLAGSKMASRIGRSITEAASTVSSTSTEIAATVTQHERTSNQQSSMAAETATTMEELAASSRQTTEQATSASELASKGSILTEDGRVAVQKARAAMDELSLKITAVAEQVLDLGEQTGQIGNIAELVKDLAVQINMLALNAAVEAVRAGEQGKGFAVVASEVRKLAAESKKSVDQVAGIVSAIQKATDRTIMRTEEGTKTIENVSSIVRTVDELFESLFENSDLINNSSQQVLLNLKQQSIAFDQVVEASRSIKEGASETAAGISQTKVGILNLNETTSKLNQML